MSKKKRPDARPMEVLLTTRQAAALLGIHENTLRRWRDQRPTPIRFVQHSERTIRYRIADLLSYQQQPEAIPT
jgi:transposase-like protein